MSGSKKVSDMTGDEFADSISKALGGRSSSTSSFSGSSDKNPVGIGAWVKDWDKSIAGGVQGIDKLKNSSSLTSTVMDGLNTVISKFSPTLGTLSGSLSSSVAGSVDSYQKQQLAGTSWAGGLREMENDRKALGLSQQEYADRQRDMARNALALSGQSGEAMKKLTDFSDDFKKTDVGKQLQSSYGMNALQMQAFTDTWVSRQDASFLKDEKSKAAALKSLEGFTQQTIRASQEQGVSVDVMLKQNKVMNESLQMQLLRLDGDEKQNEALNDLLPQLSGLGPELKNLAMEAASDMGVTGKGAMTESVLGDAGREFSAAVKNMKEVTENGGTQQEKNLAEQRLIAARVGVDQMIASKQFRDNAEIERRGLPSAGEGNFLALMQERLPNVQKDRATGADLRAANLDDTPENRERLKAERNRRDMTATTETGEKRSGAAVIDVNQQANMEARNNIIAAEVEAIKGVIGALDRLGGKIQSVLGERTTSGDLAGRNGQPGSREQYNSSIPRNPTLYPTDKRNTGTEGEIKEKLEPKDVIAQLHKGEKVLKPEDAMKFESIGGLDFLKSAPGGKMPAGMPNDMLGGMDPSKMFGDMQKQMAPMMGDIQKQMAPMMGEMKSAFSNIKMPSGFDTSKITSMLGNIKQPDMGQLANMAKSMIPPTDGSAAAMSKDMMSNLKSTVSSIAQQPNVSEPVKNEYDDEGTTPTVASPTAAPTDSINSDILNALNNLNKLTAQSLDALVRTAGHAEKTAGGIDGMNANRFG